MCTRVLRLSMAASSIRYSASFGGSAMPAQHTRSTGLLCGRPVALELDLRDPDLCRDYFRRLQKTHLFTLYWNIKRIRDVLGRYALQSEYAHMAWTTRRFRRFIGLTPYPSWLTPQARGGVSQPPQTCNDFRHSFDEVIVVDLYHQASQL